ncbi:hypothetical protein MNBD_GAMMA07-1423, partial [hydrothermal vent metagenome]
MSLSQPNLSQSILSFMGRSAPLLIILPLFVGSAAHAGAERDQARRIHDRLTGIPPSN